MVVGPAARKAWTCMWACLFALLAALAPGLAFADDGVLFVAASASDVDVAADSSESGLPDDAGKQGIPDAVPAFDKAYVYALGDDGAELVGVVSCSGEGKPETGESLFSSVPQVSAGARLSVQDDDASVEYLYEFSSTPDPVVSIPAEIEGKPVTSIGDKAFEDQIWLKKVEIPASVKRIGVAAFRGCKSLESVDVPANCELGTYAFSECESLAHVELGEGVVFGYVYANDYDDGYWDVDEETGDETWVSVPRSDSWTSYSNGVFERCISLTSISLPKSVTVIPVATFESCSALERVDFPTTLEQIDSWAFAWCTSLKSLDLPSGLNAVESYAFYECCPAHVVELPASLTTIGTEAFFGWRGDGYWEYDEETGESFWAGEKEFSIQTATWAQYWKLRTTRTISNERPPRCSLPMASTMAMSSS